MNQIVIRREKDCYHSQKDVLFDILSMANPLHRSKYTYLDSSKYGKIYFSENQVPDLIKQEQKHLPQAIKSQKELVKKDLTYKENKLMLDVEARVENEAIDKLFAQAREDATITFDLID